MAQETPVYTTVVLGVGQGIYLHGSMGHAPSMP
jgi:hypothetical protein